MTAFNVVRMRVKPGREEEFLALNEESARQQLPGMIGAWVIKTGERSYCFIGQWQSMDAIAAARPAMIANLDTMRGLLEDLGGGLGVTDPVSGDVVAMGHGGSAGDR